MLNSILLSTTMLLLASKPIQAFNCATHTYGSCEDKIVHWYDPDDGLICDPLDCGGGRAAPKTDVPGCANYKGTSTRAGSSYLSCFKTKELATSTKAAVFTTTSTPPAITTTATSTAHPVTTILPSSSQSSSASILSSATSTESTGMNPSSTSPSTSTASPSTTSPPTLSTAAVQDGTSVSSSSPSSSSSAVPNAGGKASIDSMMAVGLGLAGVIALA